MKKKKSPTQPAAQEQEIEIKNSNFNKDEIIELIESYQNENKCVIYQYRRNIIIDSIVNKKISRQRAFYIIDSCYLAIQ